MRRFGISTFLLAALAGLGAASAAAQSSSTGLQPVVPKGAPFHGVHGLRLDGKKGLYATSVIGQSIFRIDTETGEIERVVGPPEGMGDDIAIAPDGTLVWNAIEDGITYAKPPGGPIRRLMENRKGVNAVSFSPDGERLFVSLVFYGDALYELDLAGRRPPRLVVENIGGLNAFQVGEDGMIYGPLMFKGQVARIDPDDGRIEIVADGFESPGALKLDFEGHAYVLDGRQVVRLDLATGATRVVAELSSDGDNLALDADERLFASLAAEDAIADIDLATGRVGYLVPPSPLDSPAGLAVDGGNGEETLYVGDLFGGLRVIDPASGHIQNTPLELFQPTHVSVQGDHLIVVGEVFGEVQRVDRKSFAVLADWGDFDEPGDALEAPDGTLVVAETGTGRVLHVTGSEASDRTAIASDLAGPRGLAWAGPGSVYVTETGGGRLLRVDVASGESAVLATGLEQPEGLAVLPDGGVAVVEVAGRRLVRIDPASGAKRVMAADLPVGLANGPSLYRGVAASGTAVYMSSDVDNTVYRLAL
jgi:sugar lactone lactonase YvrE